MKTQKKLFYASAVGFVTLFIWNVLLFPGQRKCDKEAALISIFGSYAADGHWQPLELKAPIVDDNSHQSGWVSCSFDMRNNDSLFGLSNSTVSYVYGPPEQQVLCKFPTEGDRRAISFIYNDTIKQIIVQQVENCWDLPYRQKLKTLGYIGPKGYFKTMTNQGGVFENPLWAMWERWRYCHTLPNTYSLLFYEPSVRRFYRIDMEAFEGKFKKQTYSNIELDSIRIVEGPVQEQSDWHPVQVGSYIDRIEGWERKSGLFYSNLDWKWEPSTKNTTSSDGDHGNVSAKDPNMQHGPYAYDARRNAYVSAKDPNIHPISEDAADRTPKMESRNFFVLHQNGRIDYVDGESLKVVKHAGYLPEIGFYRNSASRCPRDMTDYAVGGIYDPNEKFLGTAVAAISRDRIMGALDFYDAQGNLAAHKLLGEDWMHKNDYNNEYYTFGLALLDTPDGSVVLAVRYLLENLQSPLLRLLDMPAARWVNPDNRYSTLFVHPNSMVGLIKMEWDKPDFWAQLSSLMLPSLILSVWLAFKMRRKAVSLGYDKSAKDCWSVAILAFGIPAYITFRLTEPKQRMVTCANCGNLRRVEFEACQSCKRDWQKTRDLTIAPDWCVRDSVQHEKENSAAVS